MWVFGCAWRRRTLPAALAILLTVLTGMSTGAAPESGRAAPAGRGFAWQGRHFEVASGGDPAICAPESCEEVEVNLRPDPRRRGRAFAVEFAIRWPSEYDDFDLDVFRPDGTQLVAAESLVGSAEALVERRPASGIYRIVVTARKVTDSAYEGAVQTEPRNRRSKPRRELLPNLRTLPPDGFHIAVPEGYAGGEPVPSEAGSCYPAETSETGTTRCLRFDNAIANTGRGELRMRFLLSGVGSDQRMQQVIRMTKGPPRYRDAGGYIWHESHGHAHYEGFAGYTLYEVDAEGDLLGQVGGSMKAGFCLQDTELTWWQRRGNGPTTFTYPACTAPHEQDSEGTWGVMGISRGWADVYTWDLPDQYVSLDGVPDGRYVLETIADAGARVKETRERDNAAWALILISGDDVELLESGTGPSPRVFN